MRVLQQQKKVKLIRKTIFYNLFDTQSKNEISELMSMQLTMTIATEIVARLRQSKLNA